MANSSSIAEMAQAPAREEAVKKPSLNLPEQELRAIIETAKSRLAPLWDVRDYVAVNPLFGYKDVDALAALKKVEALTGVLLLPDRDFLKSQFDAGTLSTDDIDEAIALFKEDSGQEQELSLDRQQVLDFLGSKEKPVSAVQILCLSDLYDQAENQSATDWVTKEVSKWASAYFDEGQALWTMPGRDKALFVAWKNLIVFDSSSERFSPRLRELADTLPEDPTAAIRQMLATVTAVTELNQVDLEQYLSRLLATVQGWASYIQKIEFEDDLKGREGEEKSQSGVIDILAIRLAYDLIFLAETLNFQRLAKWERTDAAEARTNCHYAALLAHEVATRRKLASKLRREDVEKSEKTRPLAQMAFCIDVRSEVIRRHLEQHCDGVQTIGFAGFFGMPIAVQKLGFRGVDPQCPILINPALELTERVSGQSKEELSKKRQRSLFSKFGLKESQAATHSSFALAETFGFLYSLKMLLSSFFQKSPNMDIDRLGLHSHGKLSIDDSSVDFDTKVQLAQNALTNMSLTEGFAKYVFFFGHGAEAANNPYASALDCGACAGHNGQYNAQLLAQLLNDPATRDALKDKGMAIPEDTLFISGWHNTTKDILVVDDLDSLIQNSQDLETLRETMEQACADGRRERLQLMSHDTEEDCPESEVKLRAHDWSEVRQEWGLARNHSLIVGSRELTRKINLEGRSFLHDYNEATDPDLAKLELIMTAPMIVTNWINMQYYASAVDPVKFGTGNKILNNVVGTIGCIQGNESDLLGGLSEQSVRYKGDYFHEPIRLQVFIEAKTSSIDHIIEKHELVSELIGNGWLNVISIDPESYETKLKTSNHWRAL